MLRSQEMEAVLSRNWVARLAFCWKNHVDIEPIYYVYEKPWLFGRTSVGAKLVAMAHNEWCAAVVDEIEDMFDWRSVIVKGPFRAFNSSLGTGDEYKRAVAAIRRLLPSAFQEDDPVPERNIVFGIYATEMTGRRMKSG